MRTVEAGVATEQFARLLREVEEGEEIIIMRDKRPVARLSPLRSKQDEKRRAEAVRRMKDLMEEGLDFAAEDTRETRCSTTDVAHIPKER
jgi:antitoxin (DNA-binding transcriptional repressor) of toxin-antitoxin stability system